MPGTSSSPRTALRAGLLGAALALAACTEREIEVTPFRIQATLDGAPVPTPTGGVVVEFQGTATVDGDRALRVTNELGQVLAISFDEANEPEVRFPADLMNRDTVALLQVDDAHVDPKGEPLRFPALAVLARNNAGFFEFRLLIGETTYTGQSDLAALPILFLPPSPVAFPRLQVRADSLYFEPAECGLVYYDRLRVDADEREDLRHHTTRRFALGSTFWNVRHVVSWHREGDCPDHVPTWTQFALWQE